MRIKILFAIGFYIFFQIGCIGFSFSRNNVWKVPDTKLSVAVEKQKPSVLQKTVERKMVLREDYSDKSTFRLAPTDNAYSRVNVYQVSDHSYLVRDAFESYELNTQTKSLRKISTPTNSDNGKFVGSFDDNDNGSWRFIPASEREEIAIGTKINEG